MSGLAMEEYELLEDPKYRAYVASVDKALRNFESTSEWADLISTLGKLNKVLLSHMKYPVVPRRIIISKRLAQCLHPALPSGVHLKALEIYDIIFKCMGTNRLSQELFIYSAGLFPMFSSAAMNVRTALLTIYENHFVPLGTRLRPGLNGFLAGTLSGLEEGSDHLERTSILLQKVAEGVGQTEFFGCLWDCILSNSNVRLPAVNHITICFNKKMCTEDQLHILGTSIDMMVCGLCRALEDSAVLVQRAALDLTLLLLPMHNTQLLRSDLTAIVSASLTVLLRRDMSLNRRLFAWLLGSEVNLSILSSEHPVMKKLGTRDAVNLADNKSPGAETYFQAFSQSLLVAAFIDTLKFAAKSKDLSDFKPYRIIIPLLDKPEIGQHILDKIFLDLLRCVYHMCEIHNNEQSSNGTQENDSIHLSPSNSNMLLNKIPSKEDRSLHELTKTVLLVFSSLQPSYPWYHLLTLLNDCCHHASTTTNNETKYCDNFSIGKSTLVNEVGCQTVTVFEVCKLLEFLMTILPLDTQQHLLGAHLPEVLSSVTCLFTDFIETLSTIDLQSGLQLCKALLEKLIPSVTHNYSLDQDEPTNESPSFRSYPFPFHFKPPVISELHSLDSSISDNGIIQIGIDAEKELAERTSKGREANTNLINKDDTDKSKEPAISLSEDEGVIIGMEGTPRDYSSSDKSLDSSDMSQSTSEIISPNKESSQSSEDNVTKPCTLPFKVIEKVPPNYSGNGFDSFETELPFDYSDQRLNTCENDGEGLLENSDIPESSFLYKYIKEFKNFFLLMVGKLLLSTHSKTITDLEKLLFMQVSQHSDEAKLSMLMKECLNYTKNDSDHSKLSLGNNRPFNNEDYLSLASFITLKQSAQNYLSVFKIACAILVELSSMPAIANFPCNSSASSNPKHLPSWLLSLIACIIASHQASPAFTQTSIATLLELVALAKSDLSAWKADKVSEESPEGQGVITLRMLPLLMPVHTHSLLFHTYIFQYLKVAAARMQKLCLQYRIAHFFQEYVYNFMTRELWNHLDVSKREYHVTSSELLLQLHGLSLPQGASCSYLPQDLSVVEREILRTLTTQLPSINLLPNKQDPICWTQSSIGNFCDSSSIIRWMTLWQVSRSLSRSIIQSYPYLNRCLFLMVERLRSQSVLERSYSQNWLTESLNCGDLGRILDPILVFLLHPHTRRISVQHVNVEKISHDSKSNLSSNVIDESTTESQIYAISSVGGEVMYHIGKGPPIKLKREAQLFSALKKQIFAFTSVSNESNKYVTKQINLPNYEEPNRSHSNGLPISLMVNPFSHHPWIDMEDLAKMNKSGNVSKTNCATSVAKEGKSDLRVASKDLAKCILDEIIDKAVTTRQRIKKVKEGSSSSSSSSPQSSISDSSYGKDLTLHPLHSHMLLYMQLVDAGQCLYGLNLIKNILDTQPKLFLLSLASSSINLHNSSSPLLVLLARHRRSVFGEGFDGGNVADMVGQFRSTMYLQVVITVCLYFIRSYYSQQPHLHVQQEHLHDNRELQVVAAEALEAVFTQLIPLVVDSPRGFSPYVRDLLNKCKVQKCVLHCLLSTVHVMKENCSDNAGLDVRTLTQDVLEYNFGTPINSQAVPQEQCYIFCLMDLTLSLIKLEDALQPNRSDPVSRDLLGSFNSKKFSLSSLRYIFGHTIPSQPMFLWAIVLVLSQESLRHFHSSWVTYFTASLPYTGPALPLNCLRVMTLICSLLEGLSDHYKLEENLPIIAPSDYTLHLLSSLMNVVHFCLLDQALSPVCTLPSASIAVLPPSSPVNQTPGQILYNLLHVFSPAGEILDASLDSSSTLDPMVCARKTLLSHLPRLISALLSLWISTGVPTGKQAFILGHRQSVRQQIVELLSPICHHHTSHLLAAVGVVWQGVSDEESITASQISLDKKVSSLVMWQYSKRQISLVEMLAALKVLPLHSLVENVKQVFRNPPVVEGALQKSPLEVSILQLFYSYVKETASSNQLSVCWGPLLSLVREGILCLPPPALLVLLAVLNEFVQRSPPVLDKKEIKDQQDVTSKLLDAISSIAGSKLEATNWLRRNLTVKPDSSEDLPNEGNSDVSVYSVAALSVLAELLAPMLDVLYSSEEKERIIPLLINIMANVIPYLRNHSSGNMAAFHACSQLISSLSGYQYTLKAWRKDILELLLDNNTFRMLPETLNYWRTLIDNLCTHDKTIFKELLTRISMSQGGSLNLFTSKEAEYETRACFLKRLAFTIFCSETDQYLKLIPDIQERLTEVTRLGQVVPGLVAQVFFCFRVLLLRISPRGTTSLWPIVITELVQVFLMMEQELSTDSDQFSSNKKHGSYHLKRLSTLDSKWVVSAHNGLHAHNNPAWLSLYLAACKLLDLMIALPANKLPQFQMYRWAFVGPESSTPEEEENKQNKQEFVGGYLLQSCEFVPHVARIAKLMNQKRSKMKQSPLSPKWDPLSKGDLLLSSTTSISTLMDLHSFFSTLTSSFPFLTGEPTRAMESRVSTIEAMIEKDFLEPILH